MSLGGKMAEDVTQQLSRGDLLHPELRGTGMGFLGEHVLTSNMTLQGDEGSVSDHVENAICIC